MVNILMSHFRGRSQALLFQVLVCVLALGKTCHGQAPPPPPPAPATYTDNPTIMRYSFSESDPKGPQSWNSLPGARYTENHCGARSVTPLKINSHEAFAVEQREGHETEDERERQAEDNENEIDTKHDLSLEFTVNPDIDRYHFSLGHPLDSYHGLEIRGVALGAMILSDEFDSHKGFGYSRTKADEYTFHFAAVTYCKHPKGSRSSHQIDDEIFKFEIHFLFFKMQKGIGIDKLYNSSLSEDFVMVSVLGRVSAKEESSILLEPVVKAVKEFKGYSFDDYTQPEVMIDPPFSVSWLVPRNSGYYYYDNGTFPVPPCFRIPRVYVIKDPLLISQSQLDAIAGTKTPREPGGLMPCTFGVLKENHDIHEYDIKYNRNPIVFEGASSTLPEARSQNEGPGMLRVSKGLIMVLFMVLDFAFR